MVTIDSKEVIDNLDNFIKNKLDELLKQSMTKACIYVEGKAKENCPVDDGQLRQSITHEVDINNGKIEGYIGTNVEYAPYVHQGTGIYATEGNGRKEVPWVYISADGKTYKTKGQKAQPFLKIAIEKSKDKIASFFENII